VRITILAELAVDGRPVRGERLAAVIRELVGARGRTVSVPALVEAVWDGSPPGDAAGAVQALVSRARRLGLPVRAVSGGYRVPSDEVSVDIVQARELLGRARAALRSGDPAAARRTADAARTLFPESPELTDAERVRLFADVTAARAQAALAGTGPPAGDDPSGGPGPSVEADLRILVGRTPPDEPSAALLVRVLAAGGRDAEALELVEHLRTDLAERYGSDPSSVVAQAHGALLRGELGPSAQAPRPPTGLPPSAATAPAVPAPRHPAATVLPASWRRPGPAMLGRDRDLAAVSHALDQAPLVTLVAPGGTGKTRLAAEIARRAADAGRPVRVVELAGLRSSDEVLPALLAAIGGTDPALVLPEAGSERQPADPPARLRTAARDLEGLVVLDNCEHLLDAAAAAVGELLAVAAPDLAVLATSRAPLSLLGEVVHRLPLLPDDDALTLLRTRVRAAGTEPIWDDDRALALCHRLDNLPLALELAAARLRHMPLDDVLAGLEDRSTLLDDALRGLPDRHTSLWALVDWSRELLAPPEQDLLQRLSVVPGPFTADLAAAVVRSVDAQGPGDGVRDVRRGLAALVEQSLLSLEETDDGPPRYRMLETVREYGDLRLSDARSRSAALDGLVAWARERAVGLARAFVDRGQLSAVVGCGEDHDNLVAALRWSLSRDDDVAAVDIAVPLFHLWTVRGLHHEVTNWGGSVFRVYEPLRRRTSTLHHGTDIPFPTVPDPALPFVARTLPDADMVVQACLLVGLSSGVLGADRLLALTVRALRTVSAQRPHEISSRWSALMPAMAAVRSTDLETGVTFADGLVAHLEPYVQGFGLFLRAALQEHHGLYQESIGDIERAYHCFEEVGDHWGRGLTAQNLGEWLQSRGDPAADGWLRRGERHFDQLGAAQDAGAIRVQLDVQRALAGDEDAVRRLEELVASPGTTELDAAQVRLGLARLAWRHGRLGEVLERTDAILRTTARSDFPLPQLRVILRISAAVLRLRVATARTGPGPATAPDGADGADEGAAELLALVGDEIRTLSDVPVLGSWALGGATLAAHRGDVERARQLWALGMRLGANAAHLIRDGNDERLAAALDSRADHEPFPTPPPTDPALPPGLSVAEAGARVRELMDELLG
jgi:predicted ATPase